MCIIPGLPSGVPGFEPDFFAFGATIYYMFKGRAPFHSNEQMMEQRAVPNSWRGISPVAQDLIESLLKYDMTQRLTDWTQGLASLGGNAIPPVPTLCPVS